MTQQNMDGKLLFSPPQVKKGVVTKGGRFRPDRTSLRTSSGSVLLHRSSVNRFEHFPIILFIYLFIHFIYCMGAHVL